MLPPVSYANEIALVSERTIEPIIWKLDDGSASFGACVTMLQAQSFHKDEMTQPLGPLVTYLADFLRLNLNQSRNFVAVLVFDRDRLEGIGEHFISAKATLVNDHLFKDNTVYPLTQTAESIMLR
jgi:hypothetical protein